MKLATHVRGSGSRTAALAHGASMTADIWRDFGDVLIERYDLQLILFDQRGHGTSPRASSYYMDDFVQDLVETLPTGLDFLIGQSLGGIVGAKASAALQPKRFIGLDPAMDVHGFPKFMLKNIAPYQAKFPNWLFKALGSPPKGAAPDTMERFRASWKQWDTATMKDLAEFAKTPFQAGPPPVPSTLVLADKMSFAVSKKLASDLAAQGWDVRVKPGAVHDLHVQDPIGLADMLDDVLAVPKLVKQ